MISLDVRNLKERISNQDIIVSEVILVLINNKLRIIHIQMDDLQLYQIIWSFLVVYMASILLYSSLLVLAIYWNSVELIRNTFRVVTFILIYQFVEIILRRYFIY